MPGSADETRTLLLDAAERRFAEDGIVGATFADIIDDAGQRNNSAIQYHFGDRIGLLEAVTVRRVHQMAAHRNRLVEGLSPSPSVRELVEVVVLPLAELLDHPGGSAYLRIQAELLAHPAREELPPVLAEPWRRPGLSRVVSLLTERLAERGDDSTSLRVGLATTLIMHSLADRVRSPDRRVHDAQFVRGVVAATVAIFETSLD